MEHRVYAQVSLVSTDEQRIGLSGWIHMRWKDKRFKCLNLNHNVFVNQVRNISDAVIWTPEFRVNMLIHKIVYRTLRYKSSDMIYVNA